MSISGLFQISIAMWSFCSSRMKVVVDVGNKNIIENIFKTMVMYHLNCYPLSSKLMKPLKSYRSLAVARFRTKIYKQDSGPGMLEKVPQDKVLFCTDHICPSLCLSFTLVKPFRVKANSKLMGAYLRIHYEGKKQKSERKMRTMQHYNQLVHVTIDHIKKKTVAVKQRVFRE